ncbi:MAG TPA: acyltransferase [Xanthomonadaceae bacterium]|nr:acyltransferase [Xanthomonadaceae bacterium]
MSSLHWADIGERTFAIGIRFLGGVYRWFGRVPFRICLYPVLLFYWLTSATARRASMEYLQRIQASHQVFKREPGRRTSLRHFACFAETLLDKTLAMSGRYAFDRVIIYGAEAIVENIEAGQGGLIITAHLGCLELMQASASLRSGLKINILVHTAHAERFNRILAGLNPEAQVQLLQVSAFNAPTAMLLADRVAAGEWIAIAGDRIPVSGDRALRVSFLGKPALFPAGPYLLASLLRCPVYLMACVHEGTGYRASVHKLTDRVLLPRAQREQAMTAYAASFVRWIEERLRESPLDWFNFYAFWDQTSRDVSNPT